MTTKALAVHRVEIHPLRAAGDPVANRIIHEASSLGMTITAARSARVYLIEAEIDDEAVETVCGKLLADPVTEQAVVGSSDPAANTSLIEIHPLPGVMDPAAGSVRDALRDVFAIEAEVSTGVRYEFEGLNAAQADTLARRLLANTVVQEIHTDGHHPAELPKGHAHESPITHIPVRGLNDGALEKLSREAHLFLSLDEMRAIRDEYRTLEREPTDIELETLAQTWSEHCVHKTLKSTITYRNDETSRDREGAVSPDPVDWTNRPGHELNPDGSVTIHNLLKSTVAAATHELIEDGVDWTLSVFVDNAGIIEFDEDHAVCVKVETHNHPSAIEPYGGAATGIGGCIRDIIGTGMAAKPIASTDVFCVAYPDHWEQKSHEGTEPRSHEEEPQTGESSSTSCLRASVPSWLPQGTLHPRRVLSQVVAGVRDYGNRMGIPTVNGAVWFDDRYVGNPLVYCGSVGVMPRGEEDCMVSGDAQPGDRIIALGGRTGRDGIHGATFSSAELTDTHADEFAHAVQIGNPIEEKRVLDAILRARDHVSGEGPGTGYQAPDTESRCPVPGPQCLFTAITDCGAGGFSSAVGEMGEKIGAEVHLDRAPLKYPGLTHTEIWISEAQERMVLAVPAENVPALQMICDEEHVELADLGHFGTPNQELILNHLGVEVGRLPMAFMHDGIPMPTREAVWKATEPRSHEATKTADHTPLRGSVASCLRALLSHPNIASKHHIIRQYDHEVQGATVIRPLGGPAQRGPMDAAVIEPVPGTGRGLAIASGLGVPESVYTGTPCRDPEYTGTPCRDPEYTGTPCRDPEYTGTPCRDPEYRDITETHYPGTRHGVPVYPIRHGVPDYPDPYLMALAAIDECVRNLVCVGADPDRIAILDNFCWPSCKKPENLASLVRAAEGCYDGAKAYRTPFVSGKDSLNNQFTTEDGKTIEIPPTLLITGIGIVPDINKCVTMDAKKPGNTLVLVGPSDSRRQDWTHTGPATARLVASAIRHNLVRSAHDISDGGPLCAIAEMLIAGSTEANPIGADIDLAAVHEDTHSAAFSEDPCRYLLEIEPAHTAELANLCKEQARSISIIHIGGLTNTGRLSIDSSDTPVEDLASAWLGTLDW